MGDCRESKLVYSSVASSVQEPIAKGIRWNLGDVLPAKSGKVFTSELERFEGSLSEFEGLRSKLETMDSEKFANAMNLYESIVGFRSRLGAYAYMYFSEDTRSQDSRTFKSRVEEIDTDASNRTLFFELWWKSLSESRSKELGSELKRYEYFLEKMRKTRPYTLTEQVEQAINLKDSTGRSALLQLYHQIIDSLLFETVVGGEKKKVTAEELRDLFYSKDRQERISAYKVQNEKYYENRDLVGEIFKSLVRDWRNEGIKLRKYPNSMAIRNISNDVPDEAVETLLTVCKKNSEVFQRFFRVKARLLELKDYGRHDLYAPLPHAKEEQFSWKKGVELVLGTFSNFNSEFAEMAKRVFDNFHLDAEARADKLGGAYCMSVTPQITPYVLLSYTGTARSVSTLAHELGHAVHSGLSSKSNNQLTFEAPLPLAETASVFGEQLLVDRLMSEADEPTRRSLLVEMVGDWYATIQRQAFFVLFEREAHERIPLGLNVDELSDIYLENLKVQFGSSLVLGENFKNEWLGIPHFFQTPFYCYAYSWGNLMVLALYKEFKEIGAKEFAPRYLKLLSYGGSQPPEKILSEAGFDIRSEAFWQSGFDQISSSVSELEKIA